MHPLLSYLAFCNVLWDHGYFYTAVIIYLPVQIGIVLVNNIQLYAVMLLGANYRRVHGQQ